MYNILKVDIHGNLPQTVNNLGPGSRYIPGIQIKFFNKAVIEDAAKCKVIH